MAQLRHSAGHRRHAWSGKYRGQTQKWFALRFTGDGERDRHRASRPAAMSRNSSNGAGRRCRTLPDLVVPFKRASTSAWSRNSRKLDLKIGHRMQGECGSRYCASSRLQGLQLFEMAAELVARASSASCGDIFLRRSFDFGVSKVAIEILARHRAVGEHCQAGRTDFGKAAGDTTGSRAPPRKMVTMPGRSVVTSGAWPPRCPCRLRRRASPPDRHRRRTARFGRDELENAARPCRSLPSYCPTPRPRASCPSRPLPRSFRPCRTRPPADGRTCLRPDP